MPVERLQPEVIRRGPYHYVPPRGQRLDYSTVHVPDPIVVPVGAVTHNGEYVFHAGEFVTNADGD